MVYIFLSLIILFLFFIVNRLLKMFNNRLGKIK